MESAVFARPIHRMRAPRLSVGRRGTPAYIVSMRPERPLQSIPDDELLERLAVLLRDSRRVEADLVAHVAEVDERRLYAREACPSMFAYCTEVLHLSEAEAYLRIAAARASRQHPVLLGMLAEGRLHLTAIARLAPHLTPANRHQVLERAAWMSKRQIDELVAELAPRPDVASSVRKLPSRPLSRDLAVRAPRVRLGSGDAPGSTPSERRQDAPAGMKSFDELCPDGVAPAAADGRGPGGWKRQLSGVCSSRVAPGAPPAGNGVVHGPSLGLKDSQLRPDGVAGGSAARDRVSIEPLSPARYKVQFTASATLREKLERLQALMRSSLPDADLAGVIEAAVTEKLERLEAQRFAKTTASRRSAAHEQTNPSSRHIPAAVRRAVYERDGGRCRFVDERGRRCTARSHLEFHHRHPFGYGGDHSFENIRLMCRTHNDHLARHDYGSQRMAQHRRRGDRASVATCVSWATDSPPTQPT
jgi:5-methylcytosine-specific restriction endonuclease McrA